MNTAHEQVKDRLDSYLTHVASNKGLLKTERSCKSVSERLRRDQIDLILCQLDDMDEVTLKRAINTLKQLAG